MAVDAAGKFHITHVGRIILWADSRHEGEVRTDACVGIRRSSMMGLLRWWMGHSLIVCDDAFLKLSENHREAAGMMTWRCRRASDRVWASS